jgi:exodeoxyribonuclease VII large subunit
LPVHAAAAVGPGARLNLEFADGRIAATADADRPAADRPAATATPAKPVASEPKTAEQKTATPKRAVKPVEQGSLF